VGQAERWQSLRLLRASWAQCAARGVAGNWRIGTQLRAAVFGLQSLSLAACLLGRLVGWLVGAELGKIASLED